MYISSRRKWDVTGNLLLGGAVNNYFKPSTLSPWTTHITLEKKYGDLSCVCQSENYCQKTRVKTIAKVKTICQLLLKAMNNP